MLHGFRAIVASPKFSSHIVLETGDKSISLEQTATGYSAEESLRQSFERIVVNRIGFLPPCGKANCLIRNANGEYRSEYVRGAFFAFCEVLKSNLSVITMDECMAYDMAERLQYVIAGDK